METAPTPIAWLTHSNRIYATAAQGGSSAICTLIEKIYALEAVQEKSRARSILRERIFSNAPASFTDSEMVKITAKRFTSPAGVPPSVGELSDFENVLASVDMRNYDTAFSDFSLQRGQTLTNEEIEATLTALRTKVTLGSERWNSDRAVSALLVDARGGLLAWSWNTNAVIRTRHAEWNLCTALDKGRFGEIRKIPSGSTLYVSLKPCRMCAAKIWECAEDPGQIRVVYFENDPGPLAQGTLLEKESPARLRALGARHVLFRVENQFQAKYL